MKKIICLFALAVMLLVFSQAGAAEKAEKEAAGAKKTTASTAKTDENIKAEEKETEEITNEEEKTGTAKTKAAEASDAKIKTDGNSKAAEARPEEKKKDLYFSMSTKSRVEVEKENRFKEKLFLEKISNKYFKIYEDEDYYTVLAKLPYAESDTDYKFNFKNENLLIINFKSKKEPEKEAIRYEITLPKKTAMEATKLMTKGDLELVIPIDFFYEERNAR